MAIYKVSVSAASDAYGTSLHNSHNLSHESKNAQKIYAKMWKVMSKVGILQLLQFKFKQVFPCTNIS